MYDVIAIGDTTVDVFLEIEEAGVNCQLNKDVCQLTLNYADKIPVTKKTKVPAVGNAANLSVGTSRLDLKTALYTIVGNDDDGEACVHALKREGVDQRYIERDPKRGTNFSAVLNVNTERTILVFHEDRDYKLPNLAKTKWIYFSSVGKGHESLQQEIIDHVKKHNIRLGINPGTYQMKMGLEKLQPLFDVAEVLLVNKEEAERLIGKNGAIENLTKKLHETGPRIVVVTDGPNGAYCYDGNHLYHQEIYDTPVVERTGAGDSFSTGFISAIAYGNDIKEAMRWGVFNAASVVQAIGAQKKLLTKEEMQEFLDDHPEVKPKIIV